MAFFVWCILTYFLAIGIWDITTKGDARKKLVSEFQEKPLQHIYLFVWLFFGYMFFVGIIAPIFGEKEFLDSGFDIWQVGLIGFISLWVVSWFLKID